MHGCQWQNRSLSFHNLRDDKEDMSRKSWNNSNESGLLIYNRISKAASTTVVKYMREFGEINNFTHKVSYNIN